VGACPSSSCGPSRTSPNIGLQPVSPEESKALRACHAFTGDVLLVESEHDDVIPHQVVVNYREACKERAFADVPADRGRGPRDCPTRRCRCDLTRTPGQMVQGDRGRQEASRAGVTAPVPSAAGSERAPAVA
jgi:hypothetical protein